MWSYVVVALVVAMVVAPVMWIMPSPGQRRQEQMRARARALGLDVRIGELPQTRRARVRREWPRQGACYRLSGPGMRTGSRSLLVCRDGPASPWQTETGDAPGEVVEACLEPFTAAVPADVVAVELNPAAPAAFWRESGGVDSVDMLRDALAALGERLRAGEGNSGRP